MLRESSENLTICVHQEGNETVEELVLYMSIIFAAFCQGYMTFYRDKISTWK